MVLREALHGRAEEAQAPAQPLGPHVAALGMRFWNGEPRHTASSGWHKRHRSHMLKVKTSSQMLFCPSAECAHQVSLL